MSGPAILIYNMDNPRKLKLMFICSQLKLRMISVVKRVHEADESAFINSIRTQALSGNFYQRPND